MPIKIIFFSKREKFMQNFPKSLLLIDFSLSRNSNPFQQFHTYQITFFNARHSREKKIFGLKTRNRDDFALQRNFQVFVFLPLFRHSIALTTRQDYVSLCNMVKNYIDSRPVDAK